MTCVIFTVIFLTKPRTDENTLTFSFIRSVSYKFGRRYTDESKLVLLMHLLLSLVQIERNLMIV